MYSIILASILTFSYADSFKTRYRPNLQSLMEFGSDENVQGVRKVGSKDINNIPKNVTPASKETSREVYMEASVSADDIMRAGGFGTTDDISSLLPVARDSTDFEAHVQAIQNYEDLEVSNPPEDILEVRKANVSDIENLKEDASGEVNMEASITSDEVLRAGGFGATDDISSFLPVASDFTDFEAHIRDARGYEDLMEEINRPGLGWSNEKK
ncbi:hypothetical protein ACJIZ3_005662 [Penstemon smallii]|uniref:Uncharacterized protein n=1 Tax=Penstemon smallii TaxID=265156 RepID=A0ABD3S5R1_9LAMI